MSATPAQIADFTIEACVAEGAQASVYRARRGDERVALKCYRPGLIGQDERIARERQAQERVAHPSLARLLDGGLLPDGAAYLASEWIDGVLLEDRLAAGPMSWHELYAVARAVGEGLGAIHAAGIVHRDVKPSNIMLPAGGRPAAVLLDFGHSLILSEERLTDRGLVLGSASYMAPEQAAGRALDGRADLYALGVVLYRGLCGELPFSDPSPAEVLRRHQLEPVVPPTRRAPGRAIATAAEELCLWLLTKDPDRRVPSAHVLGFTLATIDPDRNQKVA